MSRQMPMPTMMRKPKTTSPTPPSIASKPMPMPVSGHSTHRGSFRGGGGFSGGGFQGQSLIDRGGYSLCP